ncbi:MAG: amino acid ABC transporter ATP-binding protein [Spirochaetaceae bacterium]|jgi:polar amino acid transport system ATP-binding protein|nr:amino acid ABC transporter ATP-binding protein [Spirochaetaceae bacterium]
MIELKGIRKQFNHNVVLDGIDLHIKKGDVLGVIGPSGTGKSTLLRCINLLERPEAGSIRIGDFCMDLSDKRKAPTLALRRRTAMVFQQFNLFKHKTALQNVMEGLVTVKNLSQDEARALAREHLDLVGLGDRLNHYPQHLSGGQQQRVAIARALAMKPQVLLFDEPTSALDPELVGEVLDTIRQSARAGYTMMLVSHEMQFVRTVASRVIFLEGGKIVEDGSPEEVFTRPRRERTKEFLARISRLNESDDYTI